MKKKWYQIGINGLVWVLVFLCLAPFGAVLVHSVYQPEGGISFQAYYEVFLASPQYLLRFWRSLGIALGIVTGQVFMSILAGYGFARYRFPGRNGIFFVLMIFMVLPLQVTLIPNYILLDRLHLLGTTKALILPSIFVPLGTFLMKQSFQAVSEEVLDAAQLDGCGLFRILFQIAVPMCKGCVFCVGVLSFLNGWNMVEQPITYLKDFERYPLAVALVYVSSNHILQQFVCCLLVLLPPLFLFSCFHKEMVDGIVLGEEK